jgi:hypothetical protein
MEKFKVFVGFKIPVCTNLVFDRWIKRRFSVSSILELKAKVYELINNYKKKRTSHKYGTNVQVL